MRAVVFGDFGTPDVLQVVDLPLPPVGPDEILVRVGAVAVDNVDTIIRRGIYQTTLRKPAITGRDLTGTVVDKGSAVRGFDIGDLVWTSSAGYDGRMGATAEYVTLSADRTYHVPESVDPALLTASVHSSSTAYLIMRRVMDLTSDQRVLIEGAGGNVGRKMVAIAHHLGALVGTTSSPRDFDRLRSLGADLCIDYASDLGEELAQHSFAPDHIVDTSGKVSLRTNTSLLAKRGQLTLMTPPAGDGSFDTRAFYMSEKRIVGFVLSEADRETLAETASGLNKLFAQGLLLDDEIEYHPFEEAALCHRLLEERGGHGIRYILRP